MIVQCGRQIESEELTQIRETVETFWRLSQWELAQTVREHLGWHTASGGNKVDACLKLLNRGAYDCPPNAIAAAKAASSR